MSRAYTSVPLTRWRSCGFFLRFLRDYGPDKYTATNLHSPVNLRFWTAELHRSSNLNFTIIFIENTIFIFMMLSYVIYTIVTITNSYYTIWYRFNHMLSLSFIYYHIVTIITIGFFPFSLRQKHTLSERPLLARTGVPAPNERQCRWPDWDVNALMKLAALGWLGKKWLFSCRMGAPSCKLVYIPL